MEKNEIDPNKIPLPKFVEFLLLTNSTINKFHCNALE